MADINTSTGSTIHGVLVIVAACIGVIGYVIRSRFNQMEMEKQEKVKQKEERRRDKLKQEEERRRAALKHCKEQLELFIGPMNCLCESASKSFRNIVWHGHEDEFAEVLKMFTTSKDNSIIPNMPQRALNRLKANDEEAITHLNLVRLAVEKYYRPVSELIKKYQFSHSEIPSQEEFDEMYPALKRKPQFSIFNMHVASIDYIWYEFEKWDGTTNIYKRFTWPKDKKHPFLYFIYFQNLVRWQYDRICKKREFLFKEDMQRKKKMHADYISQNYKVEVKS